MSKLISYSLFNNANKAPFEKAAYIRGFYFNARMNNLIYPDWRTCLHVERDIYIQYQGLFDWLVSNNNLLLKIVDYNPALCEGMIWRLKPLFLPDVSHVLCRDTDALTCYKEAQMVQRWVESAHPLMAILDNPAHGGLMGGMIGLRVAEVKAAMGWNVFEDIISGLNLSHHGSDQDMLNQSVAPRITPIFYNGMQETTVIDLPQVERKYWESNLCVSFIGAAGVNEMETLRFFQRQDIYNWKFQGIEREFPHLFHWHL